MKLLAKGSPPNYEGGGDNIQWTGSKRMEKDHEKGSKRMGITKLGRERETHVKLGTLKRNWGGGG